MTFLGGLKCAIPSCHRSESVTFHVKSAPHQKISGLIYLSDLTNVSSAIVGTACVSGKFLCHVSVHDRLAIKLLDFMVVPPVCASYCTKASSNQITLLASFVRFSLSRATFFQANSAVLGCVNHGGKLDVLASYNPDNYNIAVLDVSCSYSATCKWQQAVENLTGIRNFSTR